MNNIHQNTLLNESVSALLFLITFKPTDEDVPLYEEPWFHGTIDRKDVPTLLKNNGDYLVRESSTKPGQFVLSAWSDGQVKHFIIQTSDDVSRRLLAFFVFLMM